MIFPFLGENEIELPIKLSNTCKSRDWFPKITKLSSTLLIKVISLVVSFLILMKPFINFERFINFISSLDKSASSLLASDISVISLSSLLMSSRIIFISFVFFLSSLIIDKVSTALLKDVKGFLIS